MPTKDIQACVTLEVEVDKCALRYGEGACQARKRGSMEFVKQASWKQGNARTTDGRAYYNASGEMLIVAEESAENSIPPIFRLGWQPRATWNIGAAHINNNAQIMDGEIILNKAPLSGSFPPFNDEGGEWRVRVQGNGESVNNATSLVGVLDYRVEDDQTATYRIGATGNISSIWAGNVSSGGGQLVLENNNTADLLTGTWRLRRQSQEWVEVGRWNVGIDTISGNGNIDEHGQVYLNTTPAQGDALPPVTSEVLHRIRIINSTNYPDNRVSAGARLVFDRGNSSVSVFEFGSGAALQATFPSAIGGDGIIIVERFLREHTAEGGIHLTPDSGTQRVLIGSTSHPARNESGANYAEINRYIVGNPNTSTAATYDASAGVLRVNLKDLNNTDSPLASDTDNYFRLRLINAPSSSLSYSVEGLLTVANQEGETVEITVGSEAQMQAAFGSTNDITDGAGVWTLERGDLLAAQTEVISPMKVFEEGIAAPENGDEPDYDWFLDKLVEEGFTGETECYNTFSSCQDRDNFVKDSPGRVYKFCSEGVILDDHAPIIKSHDHQPPAIKKDFSLWQREKVSVKLEDYQAPDTRLDDDYQAARGVKGGTRTVETPATTNYVNIATWRQGDGLNQAGRAFVGFETDDSLFLALNNVADTGGLPANLSGSWRVTRHGGGLADAVVVGALVKNRDDNTGGKYTISSSADMSYAFAPGVPASENITYPTVNATWNQGIGANKAYMSTPDGALSFDTNTALPALTGEYRLRRNGGDMPEASVVGDVTLEAKQIITGINAATTKTVASNDFHIQDDGRIFIETTDNFTNNTVHRITNSAAPSVVLEGELKNVAAGAPLVTSIGLFSLGSGKEWFPTAFRSPLTVSDSLLYAGADSGFGTVALYAFSLNSGRREPAFDILTGNILAVTNQVASITQTQTFVKCFTVFGNTMWLVNGFAGQNDDRVFAININTKQRVASQEIAGNFSNAYAIHNDGATIRIARKNGNAFTIQAYNAATKARESAKDISVTVGSGDISALAENRSHLIIKRGLRLYSFNLLTRVWESESVGTNPTNAYGFAANGGDGYFGERNPNNVGSVNRTSLDSGFGDPDAARVPAGQKAITVGSRSDVINFLRAYNAAPKSGTANGNPAAATSQWNRIDTLPDYRRQGNSWQRRFLVGINSYSWTNINVTAWSATSSYAPGAFVEYSVGGQLRLYLAIAAVTYPATSTWSISEVTMGASTTERNIIVADKATMNAVFDLGNPHKPNTIPPLDSRWDKPNAPVWSSSAAYAQGDFVQAYGDLYRRISSAGDSGGNSNPATDTARWGVLPVTLWSATSPYNTNDFVQRNSALYRALANIASGAPNSNPVLDSSRWNVLTTPTWNATAAYNANAYVRRNSALYRAINNILSAAPNGNPAATTSQWGALTTPAWSGASAYNANDYVTRNNNLYRANNNISAPSGGGTTYTQIFNFPAGGNSAGLQNVAHYFDSSAYPGGICVNAAHDSLLTTTGTKRIRRVSGTTAETTGVTGTLTKANAPHGGSGYVCFRVGSVAEMRAAFGPATNITSGANWILEDVTTGSGTPNANPPADTARWNALTTPAWSGTSAYSANAYVTHNGILYRALNNIAVPSGGSTIATWNSIRATVTGAAGYDNATNSAAHGNAALFFNPTAASGNAPTQSSSASHTLTFTPSGSFSLPAGATGSVTGALSYVFAESFRSLRVGSVADMRAAFGTTDIIQHPTAPSVGTWTLTANTPNSAPNVDTTNWQVVSTTAWSGESAYSTNAIVTYNNAYYQASTNIAAPVFLNTAPESDSANWTLQTTTAWSGESAYSTNAIVTYNNAYYRALANITAAPPNTAPESDATNWQLVSPTAWSAQTAYATNAVVIYNSNYYQAATNILVAQPNTAPESDSANWQLVTPPVWSAQSAYSTNAIVLYNQGYYRASQTIPAPNTVTGTTIQPPPRHFSFSAGTALANNQPGTSVITYELPTYTAFNNTTATLRRVSPGFEGALTGIVISSNVTVVSSATAMFNEFGGQLSGAQQWTLTAGGEVKNADWILVGERDWYNEVAYNIGDGARYGGDYYVANAAIPDIPAESANPPNYTWSLERQVIVAQNEYDNPPDYTYTLAKLENTPRQIAQIAVGDNDPGVLRDESTFMRRWLSRNRFFNRRPAKFSVGYVETAEGGGQRFVPTFTANLTIDEVAVENNNKYMTFVLRDGINITKKEGAVAPKPSAIELASDINATATSFAITGDDVGKLKVGDLINIGNEVMRVLTITGSTISVDRAREGTTAGSRRRGDTVQICYVKQGVNGAEIVKDLIENFSGARGLTFAEAEFESLRDFYFGSFTLSAVIPKPVGVDVLISEIQKSTASNMWFDSTRNEFRIKSITGLNFGFSPDEVPLSDDDIIGDRTAVVERPRQSVTRALTLSGLRDASDYGADAKDWRNVTLRVDPANESANARGETRQYDIISRWINSSQARTVSDRLLQEGVVNSSDFVFEVPILEGDLKGLELGEVYEYIGRFSQNEFGEAALFPFRVLKVDIKDFTKAKITATRSSVTISDIRAFIIGKSAYDDDTVML